MIINRIRIKNYRSYYGEVVFDMSKGLTLIIGDNGDGKTTFFEALQWLFNTTVDDTSIQNFSEKRKSELEVGEIDEVLVAMEFEHNGLKSVEKSFSIERTGERTYRTLKFSFRGYEDNGSERVPVNGKNLMNRCFDAYIQRYSMFKGESTLNVFDNPTALRELVEKFSDLKKFETFVEMLAEFERKANNAYVKECKNDEKVSKQAKRLEIDLRQIEAKISDTERDIRQYQESINTFTGKIEDLEKHQDVGQKYQDLKERLHNLTEKRNRFRGSIAAINFNTSLLDQLWVLCAFPDVLKEFQKKSSAFSRLKRTQNDAFIKEQAKREGKKEAIDEIRVLANGSPKLPWYLPTGETMQEMIDDHICKVCGRPVEEGTEAYEFMCRKLDEYRLHLAATIEEANDEPEEIKLFYSEYVEELHNLSISLGGSNAQKISRLASDINDRLELVERLKREMTDIEGKIQEANDEKARLLIQADGVSEETLDKAFVNMKGFFESKSRAEKRLIESRAQLERLQEERDELQAKFDQLKPASSQVKVYKGVHEVLNRIAKAFVSAKDKNLSQFLRNLEEVANTYLHRLNATDFHGQVRLIKTIDNSAEIRLFSSNGTEVKNPSGSQQTTMYMSVLFAISDLTTLKREENYPLIFDAATSSFGDSKEDEFYNIIDKIEKQCIIVTKDFITKGQLRIEDVEHLTCTVYRIKKREGFSQSDLSTICTEVEKVK